ncbi:MAG: tRNA 2-thiocytidine(32) synthetase TtcA [Hyphomicrobiaceae bacterium]
MDRETSESCHPMMQLGGRSQSKRKTRKRLIRQVRQAIDDYAMAVAGQRWLVCLSGGKDSYTLLALLLDLQWRGVLPVELVACNLDQGQPGFPKHILPDFLNRFGVAHHIEYQDTYSIVTTKIPQQQTYCALCSRLRRGHLYRIARELKCDAIALGHHSDDILETLFLNLFYGGKLATMPAKLLNDEGDVMVLRPMTFCSEDDIARFAKDHAFPIIPCDLCGSQDGLQRQSIKAMLAEWEQKTPGRKRTMMRAIANTRPSHLLDRELFDFSTLQATASTPDHEEAFTGDAQDGCENRMNPMLAGAVSPKGRAR